jgi:uncharacterized membrane protein YgcG
MKKVLIVVAFGVLLTFMAASSAYAYEAFYGPSELLYWDPDKAANGYTMIGPYLIDMKGNVCHVFKQGGTIYEDGTMYGSGGMAFAKYDWDGNVIFDLEETRPDYRPHHDSNLIFNKALNAETVIYIANETLTHDELIAAGADPSRTSSGTRMDCLVERDQNNNVVWEWCMYDHLVQDLYPDKDNYVGKGKKISDYPGKLDFSHGRVVNHCNGFDYSPELGHIVFDDVRGEMWIIDHDGTFVAGDPEKSIELAASEKGDFLWRFGDPEMYDQGDSTHKQMGTTHDAQFIKKGRPGYPNLMIYNNGAGMGVAVAQSTIMEINPYLNAQGITTDSYVNPPEAGYKAEPSRRGGGKRGGGKDRGKGGGGKRGGGGKGGGSRLISNQLVWEFRNNQESGMLSTNGGNCIRLYNGNSLASNKVHGHFVEVTPEFEIVWEYVNPVCRTGVKKIITPEDYDLHPAGRTDRYPWNYPAFQGKDLTVKGTITEMAARGLIGAPPVQEANRARK